MIFDKVKFSHFWQPLWTSVKIKPFFHFLLMIFLLKWSPCWLTSAKLHRWGHTIEWIPYEISIWNKITFILVQFNSVCCVSATHNSAMYKFLWTKGYLLQARGTRDKCSSMWALKIRYRGSSPYSEKKPKTVEVGSAVVGGPPVAKVPNCQTDKYVGISTL